MKKIVLMLALLLFHTLFTLEAGANKSALGIKTIQVPVFALQQKDGECHDLGNH